MNTLEKFYQKDKSRVSAKIYRYFDSFKEFICCKDLPTFKIQYTDSRLDKNINYKAQILPYQTPIILKYNIALLKENSEDFKYTLVHEFTHLYDYYILSKKSNNDFLKKNMMFYTEFHAVQIEILFCYNIVKTIFEEADIMNTDLTKILVLPAQMNKTYASATIKYLEDKTLSNFYNMARAYMYACGTSSILSQLMERQMSVMKFEEPFEEDMSKVYSLLTSIRYNETPSIDLIHQIGDIQNKIVNTFIHRN